MDRRQGDRRAIRLDRRTGYDRRSGDRRVADAPHQRPRTTDMRSGERTYTERRSA